MGVVRVVFFVTVGFVFTIPPVRLPGGAMASLLPMAAFFPYGRRVSPSVIRKIKSRIPVCRGRLVSCSVALLDVFSRVESH